MIVMCEGCETSFQVEDRLIKSTGSKVRCSKCRHVFVAYAPAALAVAEEPLVLSEELPAAAANGARAEMSEIGSQIDALFADDFGVAADATADQEPELLDVEDLLAEDSPSASALSSEAPDDDLKLDLDLDLNFDEDATAQSLSEAALPLAVPGDAAPIDFDLDAQTKPGGAPGDMLASLDELGIKLDNLEGMDVGAMPAASQTDQPTGLETPDLDLELDLNALVDETAEELTPEPSAAGAEAAPPEAAVGAVAEAAFADGPEATQPPKDGELDLSDLEAMLDGDSQPMEPRAGAAELDLELGADLAGDDGIEKPSDFEELDLTSIAGETAVSADSVDAAAEPLLQFDLAPEVEDASSPAPPETESVEHQDDELDFSDITNILAEPPAEPEKDVSDSTPDLDLFLTEGPPQAAASPSAPQAEVQDGLLLDIESLLEEEPSEPIGEQKPSQESEELDFDIGVGAAPAPSDDLEIEIEPVADGDVSTAHAEPIAAADALIGEPVSTPDPSSAQTFAHTGADGATDTLDMESAAAAAFAAEAPRQSGARKYLLMAAGVLAILLAAILVPRSLDIQVPFLSDVEIPFVGKIFQSQPEDAAGNLKMAPIAENLAAEFIDHPSAGRLCVVRGQVRNNYDHPRSAIRVTAKLYTKDKTLAKTATIFAGNLLSNQEIATQDIAAVNARLNSKEGANNLNVGVKPGRSIPFMAVFDKLPDNLDEYSVEVAGSTK